MFEIKLSGSIFLHLQPSAGFYIPSNNCLFVLGGLNLPIFSQLNELYVVKSYDTTVIQPPGGISIRKLEGEILSGRIATLHIFYSCAILHSGVGFHIKFMRWYITFYKCYKCYQWYLFYKIDYESLFLDKTIYLRIRSKSLSHRHQRYEVHYIYIDGVI